LAVDGLSLLMVGLTALLGVLAVGCSWGEIQKNVGFFHLNLLWSLGGVIGVFLAIDMFLFFFFWEMMLVPIYFLIALWGHKGADGKSRVYAATKFFIYTQVAGLIMLIGILGLVVYGYMMTGTISFDYNYLLAVANTLDTTYCLCIDDLFLYWFCGKTSSISITRLVTRCACTSTYSRFCRLSRYLD
jgi:NADH-quinone oxidoreductase subunit M